MHGAQNYSTCLERAEVQGCVVAVQIGATRTQSALVNSDGNIVAGPRVFLHRPVYEQRQAEDVFATALHLAEETISKSGRAKDLSALALIVPAGVDRQRGIIHTAPGVTDLTGREVPKHFRRFGLPVFIENDANAALLFEHRLGVAKGLDDALGIHLVSGLGGAFICADRLVVGSHGHAMEFGHISINRNEGRLCGCGNQDCLECYASGSALWRSWKQSGTSVNYVGADVPQPEGDYMDVVLAAERNNDTALSLLREFGESLAEGLVTVLNIFDPGSLVFTGALSRAFPFFKEAVTDTVGRKCFADIGAQLDLRTSTDPHYGDLRGAAVVARGVSVRW